MKLKNKEDQCIDILILLRKGNKIPREGVTETKYGTETKGMTIQRLPHPIYKRQALKVDQYISLSIVL